MSSKQKVGGRARSVEETFLNKIIRKLKYPVNFPAYWQACGWFFKIAATYSKTRVHITELVQQVSATLLVVK